MRSEGGRGRGYVRGSIGCRGYIKGMSEGVLQGTY